MCNRLKANVLQNAASCALKGDVLRGERQPSATPKAACLEMMKCQKTQHIVFAVCRQSANFARETIFLTNLFVQA